MDQATINKVIRLLKNGASIMYIMQKMNIGLNEIIFISERNLKVEKKQKVSK